MAGNVEIIGQWKKTEKKMMDDAFNRLLDEATKNTGEYKTLFSLGFISWKMYVKVFIKKLHCVL